MSGINVERVCNALQKSSPLNARVYLPQVKAALDVLTTDVAISWKAWNCLRVGSPPNFNITELFSILDQVNATMSYENKLGIDSIRELVMYVTTDTITAGELLGVLALVHQGRVNAPTLATPAVSA